METRDYELMASRTINLKLNHPNQLLNAALGLCGESGEFADLIKKGFYQGHGLDETQREKLIKELGDILWYVNLASKLLDTSLAHIMQVNIRKLMERYPQGFSELGSRDRIDVDTHAPEIPGFEGKGLAIDLRGK